MDRQGVSPQVHSIYVADLTTMDSLLFPAVHWIPWVPCLLGALSVGKGQRAKLIIASLQWRHRLASKWSKIILVALQL